MNSYGKFMLSTGLGLISALILHTIIVSYGNDVIKCFDGIWAFSLILYLVGVLSNFGTFDMRKTGFSGVANYFCIVFPPMVFVYPPFVLDNQ